MVYLSRPASLSAVFALLIGGAAHSAELKDPKTLQQTRQPRISVPAEPMLKESVKKDTGDTPPALKPQTEPKKPATVTPEPASKPGSKQMPTLKQPAQGLQPQPKPGLRPNPEVKPQTGGGCPDPAIVDMIPGWPVVHDDGTYTFKLMVQIKNVGDSTYRSRANQQDVVIKEGHKTVKTSYWPDSSYHPEFAPGEGASVVHGVVNWNPRSEFLADFSAQLIYDPDIKSDGNPANDDCSNANNSFRLSVEELKRTLERDASPI